MSHLVSPGGRPLGLSNFGGGLSTRLPARFDRRELDHPDEFVSFVLERGLSDRIRSPSMKTSTSRRTLVCQPG
jgi:hypothetical protein